MIAVITMTKSEATWAKTKQVLRRTSNSLLLYFTDLLKTKEKVDRSNGCNNNDQADGMLE